MGLRMPASHSFGWIEQRTNKCGKQWCCADEYTYIGGIAVTECHVLGQEIERTAHNAKQEKHQFVAPVIGKKASMGDDKHAKISNHKANKKDVRRSHPHIKQHLAADEG